MRMSLKNVTGMVAATLAAVAMVPAHADFITGRVFQPQGENLMISPPAGWRMAYMNGDPTGDYVIEFLPPNEALDSWREGYMSVQRRTFPDSALMSNIKARNLTVGSVAIGQIMQNVQSNCPGRFMPMRQKDSFTNAIPTSVSGGFCDRVGTTAPYGEGSVVAAFQGKEKVFVVQFGWRPATANEWQDQAFRITPAKLQTYLDLLNNATLCGGADEPACPR